MRINEYIPVNRESFDSSLKGEQYYPVATRRPRLTLKHVNKLRKAREIQRLEQIKHDASIPTIYKTPEKSNDK